MDPSSNHRKTKEELGEEILANEKLGDLSQRSSRQRKYFYGRQPKGIERYITQHMAKRGYAASGSNDRLQRAWTEIVGPQLVNQTRAVAVQRGTLEVLVANSTMMQEIIFQRSELLKKIQENLPDARITSLKLRVGRITS